jgi:hypothetical protein
MSDNSILNLLPQIIGALCVFTCAIFRYFRRTVNEPDTNINVRTHDENSQTDGNATTTTTTTTITTTETHHTNEDDIIDTPIERTNSIINRINSFLKFQKEKY